MFVLSLIVASAVAIVKLPTKLGLDLQGGIRLILEAKDSPTRSVDDDAVLGVLDVIQRRVDGLGVTEPIIRRKGERQIVVELAGITDPQRARDLIGRTAQLTFVQGQWLPGGSKSLTDEQLKILGGDRGNVVEYEVVPGEFRRLLLGEVMMTGEMLESASPGTDQYGNRVVNIEFTTDGGERFYEVTRQLTGQPLAILLDGQIISAPRINESISGGRAVITGSFTSQEMRDLVVQLKAGALPVPVEIVSDSFVGPTLGANSIAKSQTAGLIGVGLLIAFMMAAYRIPGIMAVVALGCYGLFSFAALKVIGATLTLPGIAGFILTIGMAVDANVIIFERIKEERRNGAPMLGAIKSGFARAFLTVFDANVTTLMAAMVLFWLGTGTIKGFAVTLSIGIVTSMLTALIVTQLLVDAAGRRFGNRDGLFLRKVSK